jgi:hypothetical protein
MEDRATLRISSQHIANWLQRAIVTREQVTDALNRMAKKVDSQNVRDPKYKSMWGRELQNYAVQAAHSLVFQGAVQSNGYTEALLHYFRALAKRGPVRGLNSLHGECNAANGTTFSQTLQRLSSLIQREGCDRDEVIDAVPADGVSSACTQSSTSSRSLAGLEGGISANARSFSRGRACTAIDHSGARGGALHRGERGDQPGRSGSRVDLGVGLPGLYGWHAVLHRHHGSREICCRMSAACKEIRRALHTHPWPITARSYRREVLRTQRNRSDVNVVTT